MATQNPDYTFMTEVAEDTFVVNDCAECNIKAITDYIRFTRDVNGMLDDIVLVGDLMFPIIFNKIKSFLYCVHQYIRICELNIALVMYIQHFHQLQATFGSFLFTIRVYKGQYMM